MTVLSILSCKMLQDEMVWLFKNDSHIKRILIVQNENISKYNGNSKIGEENSA